MRVVYVLGVLKIYRLFLRFRKFSPLFRVLPENHMEEERSQIVEFYNDQTLFITGVTGFLGKTLLWQVLDRCSGVKKVYVLVRGKRGKPSQDRFYQDVISQSIFESIFSREPRLRDILEVC